LFKVRKTFFEILKNNGAEMFVASVEIEDLNRNVNIPFFELCNSKSKQKNVLTNPASYVDQIVQPEVTNQKEQTQQSNSTSTSTSNRKSSVSSKSKV